MSPKPQPISSVPTVSGAATLRRSTSRVSGICTSTISSPLSPMIRPYWLAERPWRPMSTERVVEPCWVTVSNRNVSATNHMKRWPRRTTRGRPTPPSPGRSGGTGGPPRALGLPARHGLRHLGEDHQRAEHRHERVAEEEPEVALRGDETGRRRGDGKGDVDRPVVERERPHPVRGGHHVRHHRLHGGREALLATPITAAAPAIATCPSTKARVAVLAAAATCASSIVERRPIRSGWSPPRRRPRRRRLRGRTRMRRDRRRWRSSPQVEGEEGDDEAAEPVDQRAGPQPPEGPRKSRDSLPYGTSDIGHGCWSSQRCRRKGPVWPAQPTSRNARQGCANNSAGSKEPSVSSLRHAAGRQGCLGRQKPRPTPAVESALPGSDRHPESLRSDLVSGFVRSVRGR